MSRQARLGLLVLVSAALFVAMLFLLANRTFLFSEVYTVQARFNQVGGLKAGAAVRYQGIAIGRVEELALPDEPNGPVTVTLAIQEKARHLVRTDTRAEIKSDGVIGNQILVLTAGSASAPNVEDGGTITGVDPFDVFDVADAALQSVAVADSVLGSINRVLQAMESGEGTVGRLLTDPAPYEALLQLTDQAERTLERVDAEAAAVGQMASEAVADLSAVLEQVRSGEGTMARLLNDRELYDTMVQTSHELEALTTRMDTVLAQAEVAAHWGTVALYRAAENMEAVQHHWLLRRFFRDRPEAPLNIREDAILESYAALDAERRALRRWAQELKLVQDRMVEAGALAPADTTRFRQR